MNKETTGPRAGAWIPEGFTPEAWTRRVLRHALEAIEAGASASLVMNVEGLKDNIRNLLAAAPAAAPAARTADDLREPKNGAAWRVEWWNESARLMLPTGSKLDSFQSYKNGTLMFTIKRLQSPATADGSANHG